MGTGVISATEAVRNFSELLNNVRYRGDRYTILRGGRAIAAIGPLDATPAVRTLGELPGLFCDLPGLDPDDVTFADDVLEAVATQPSPPGESAWE
jgi:antitoxin (DNA-binding transcriptional repressor) of toxin-antitoxin stability system